MSDNSGTEPDRRSPQAQNISIVDFGSEAFMKRARGLLDFCEGRLGGGRSCSHGRQGAALSAILNVSLRRGRDLYQGRARYSRDEAIALLEHVGVSAGQPIALRFARIWKAGAQ